MSFLEKRLSEALIDDRDFEKAGFQALPVLKIASVVLLLLVQQRFALHKSVGALILPRCLQRYRRVPTRIIGTTVMVSITDALVVWYSSSSAAPGVVILIGAASLWKNRFKWR
jgi:hypothetical protein